MSPLITKPPPEEAASPTSPRCTWCGEPLPEFSRTGRRRRVDSKTCSKRCRQNRHRWSIAQCELEAAAKPLTIAYADPPYPGRAHLYPEGEEVDHKLLIERLVDEYPDGWALSTASDALRDVLPLCPPDVRVASWHRKPRHTASRYPVSSWEPLIVRGGRVLPSSQTQRVTDSLNDPTRHHAFPNAMVGMKTPAFARWLFEQLGARPGDELVDLYPGSGAIQKAWAFYTGDPTA